MRIGKIWIWAIELLVILVGLTQLVVFIWLNPIIESSIRQLIRVQSGGVYEVKSLSVDWDILGSDLNVSSLVLQTDTTKLRERRDSLGQVFPMLSIEIPLFQISDFDFARLREARSMEMQVFRLQKPRIFIHHHQRKAQPASDTSKKGLDLYPLIEGALQQFAVQQLLIEDAYVQYKDDGLFSQQPFTTQKLDLSLTGFRIDSVISRTSSRPFHVEALEINLDARDYRFILPDSSYALYLKELAFTSQAHTLNIDSLRLVPLIEPTQEDSVIQLFVDVAQVQLLGLDLQETLTEKAVHLQACIWKEPQLRLEGQPKAKPEPFSMDTLLRQVAQIQLPVQIDLLGIQHGTLLQRASDEDALALWRAQNMDLVLTGVDFAANNEDSLRFYFFEELQVQVDTLSLNLPEPQLYVVQGAWGYSSRSAQVLGQDIRGEQQNGPQLTFELPAITIDSFHLEKLGDRDFEVALVKLSRPYIEVEAVGSPPQAGAESQANEKPIPEGIPRLGIQQFAIEEGKLEYLHPARHFLVEEFTLHGKSLALPGVLSLPTPKLLEQFRWSAAVHDLKFPLADSTLELLGMELFVDATQGKIVGEEFRIVRTADAKDQGLYAAYLPYFSLEGLNVKKLIRQEALEIEQVRLTDTEVGIMAEKGLKQDSLAAFHLDSLDVYATISTVVPTASIGKLYLDNLQIRQLKLDADSLTQTTLPLLDIALTDFYIDSTSSQSSERFFYCDDISVYVEADHQEIGGGGTEISWQGIEYSTQGQGVRVQGFGVKGMIGEEDQKRPYELVVPQLGVQGLDIYQVLTGRITQIENIYLDDPEAQLPRPQFGGGKRDSTVLRNLFPLIAPYMDLFQVHAVSLRGGRIAFTEQEAQKEIKRIMVEDITLQIDEFVLDSGAHARTDRLFFAKDMYLDFDVRGYSLVFPDSSYQLKINEVGVSTSENLIFADSILLLPLKAKPPQDPGLEIALVLPRLQLEGVDLGEIYFEQELHLEAIRLLAPKLEMHIVPKQRDSLSRQAFYPYQLVPQDPYPSFASSFKKIMLDELNVEGGWLEVDIAGKRALSFPDFSFNAFDFLIDSSAYEKLGNTYLFAKDFQLELRDYTFPLTEEGLYTLKADKLGIQASKGFLYADSLRLIPKYDRATFSQQVAYITDRFEVDFPRIEMRGLEVPVLLTKNEFRSERLDLFDPSLSVYKDKRLPAKPDKRPPWPTDAFHALPFIVEIDSFFVSDADIRYEEQIAQVDTPSWFILTSLDADLMGLHNDSTLWPKKDQLEVIAHGYIMNEGELNLKILFPLSDSSGRHSMEGFVAAMPAEVLNPIVQHTAFVDIQNGDIRSLSFNFEANKRKSEGRMQFRYGDLKVSLLNRKRGNSRRMEEKFGTMIANAFILRTNNPRKLRFLRVGEVQWEKRPDKGIIPFWVQSIVSGLKSSIGLRRKQGRDVLPLRAKWQIRKEKE